MPILGRKPGTPDTGYGEQLNNTIRAGVVAAYSKNAWVHRFGGRVGKNVSTAPTIRYGLYQKSNRAKLGQSVSAVASTTMVDGYGGADVVLAPEAPVMIYSGVEFELGYLATGSSASVGMGEWGYYMSQQNGVSSFPTTYAPQSNTPQGKLSLWLDVVDNRAPNMPGVVEPVANSTTSALRPTIKGRFSDPDETYGDKVKKFQIEVWSVNAQGVKQTRIHNSGVIGATSGVQTSKVVGWQVGSNLAGARYMARVCVWDMFDQPSAWREWLFTVNAGGAVENMAIAAADLIDTNLVSVANPRVAFKWTHRSSMAGDRIRAWLYRGDGSLVSGPVEAAGTYAVNGTFTQNPTSWGLPTIGEGKTYYYAAQVRDTSGSWSPIARTNTFKRQGAPEPPQPVSPPNAAEYSSPPVIKMLAGDAAENENFDVQYRFSINGGAWSNWAAMAYTFRADGYWWTQLTTNELTAKGEVQWQARTIDNWAVVSAPTPTMTFFYIDPPTVSIDYPGAGATIATTTPDVAFTSSMPAVKAWLTLTDNATSRIVYRMPDTSVQAAKTNWTLPVPAGKLTNTRAYTVETFVETAGGLVGSASRSFTVNYPVPAALSSVASMKVAGPFEPSWNSSEWSRIRIEWLEIPEGVAPSATFWGYVVTRLNLKTGEVDLRKVIRSRKERIFVDTTPLSGVQYQYTVAWINQPSAGNFIVSAAVTVQNGVNFSNTIISDLADVTLATTLPGYADRTVEWGAPKSVEIYETWGELPIAFQSLNRGDTIVGTWVPIDDPGGQFLHTDLINAAKQLSQVTVVDGVPTPRTLYYRDGKGRGMGCVMTGDNAETDKGWINGGEISLTLREVRVTLVEVGP